MGPGMCQQQGSSYGCAINFVSQALDGAWEVSTRPCYCSGSSCLLQARAEISLGVRQKSCSTVVLHARMRLNLDGARNC